MRLPLLLCPYVCRLPLLAAAGLAPAAGAQSVLAHIPSNTGTEAGDSVTAIGDITGDGLSEIVQGVPLAVRGGRIQIFDSSGEYIREMSTSYALEMGRAVDGGDALSGSGDVNDDGFGDVICGSPGTVAHGLACGAAVVFSGAGGSTPLLELFGSAPYGRFGAAVAMVGFVDADRRADVLVGAPEAFPPYAELYSGADGALLLRWTGDQTNDGFGRALTGVGDLDGDGCTEVLIGAPDFDGVGPNSGVARLFHGRTGLELRRFSGQAADERFGWAVASAGDVTGDGVNDIIVGGSGGVARVYSGAGGSLVHDLSGPGGFGWAVTGVGDQDGDGLSDFLVGAPFADDLADSGGNATLYSGAGAVPLYVFMGHQRNTRLGECTAIAGETNGDGWPEFLLGAIGGNKSLLCSYQRPALRAPVPGIAGQRNTVEVTNVWPGWDVTLEYAYAGALRPLIDGDGLHIDVASYPFDASTLQAGTRGSVSFSGYVDPSLSGRTVLIQAYVKPHPTGQFDSDPCAVTEAIRFTFP
ncbi:MAG: hypothetical protein EYC70_02900 [Planctomycetota bacterium]|nr:MAG: hypothetical protein EYC70_02900 [Planctomycetota bacterium]